MDYDLDKVPVPFSVTVLVCDSFLSLSLLILGLQMLLPYTVSGQWREIGS